MSQWCSELPRAKEGDPGGPGSGGSPVGVMLKVKEQYLQCVWESPREAQIAQGWVLALATHHVCPQLGWEWCAWGAGRQEQRGKWSKSALRRLLEAAEELWRMVKCQGSDGCKIASRGQSCYKQGSLKPRCKSVPRTLCTARAGAGAEQGCEDEKGTQSLADERKLKEMSLFC